MIDEAMSILQYKENKVFRMTLRSFPNRQKKRTFVSKNSRNHISSTIWKFYGSWFKLHQMKWCKHCQSPFQPEFRLSRAHKEFRLFHIFHLHKLVKTLLFIAGWNSKKQWKYWIEYCIVTLWYKKTKLFLNGYPLVLCKLPYKLLVYVYRLCFTVSEIPKYMLQVNLISFSREELIVAEG